MVQWIRGKKSVLDPISTEKGAKGCHLLHFPLPLSSTKFGNQNWNQQQLTFPYCHLFSLWQVIPGATCAHRANCQNGLSNLYRWLTKLTWLWRWYWRQGQPGHHSSGSVAHLQTEDVTMENYFCNASRSNKSWAREIFPNSLPHMIRHVQHQLLPCTCSRVPYLQVLYLYT